MANSSISTDVKFKGAQITVVGQTEAPRFGHEAMARTKNPEPTASTVVPGAPTSTV